MIAFAEMPRKGSPGDTLGDQSGFDLFSDALPFGRLWFEKADAAAGYAKFNSRSKRAEMRRFDSTSAVVPVEFDRAEYKEP